MFILLYILSGGQYNNKYSEKKEVFSPDEIFEKVRMKVQQVQIKGEHIDYLAFIPNGEPTLDINLGNEIELLKT